MLCVVKEKILSSYRKNIRFFLLEFFLLIFIKEGVQLSGKNVGLRGQRSKFKFQLGGISCEF